MTKKHSRRHSLTKLRDRDGDHAREGKLLSELCKHHGYSFSDTLPARDRSTMLASRDGDRLQIGGGVVVKLMVPADGALGRQIVKLREKKARTK